MHGYKYGKEKFNQQLTQHEKERAGPSPCFPFSKLRTRDMNGKILSPNSTTEQ